MSLYWKAVKATAPTELLEHMHRMQQEHSRAYKYLSEEITMEKWAPSHVPLCTWGKTASSLVESCNSAVLQHRYAPIPRMLDGVRIWATEKAIANTAALATHLAHLPPLIQSKLQELVDKGRRLTVRAAVGAVGEVCANETNLQTWVAVDLNSRTCCNKFRVTGLPCEHECGLARFLRLDPTQLVHPAMCTAQGRALYEASAPFPPVNTLGLELDDVKPPNEKRPRGAPRKRRIPSMAGEPRRRITCGRCHQPGHNKSSCRAPLTSDD